MNRHTCYLCTLIPLVFFILIMLSGCGGGEASGNGGDGADTTKSREAVPVEVEDYGVNNMPDELFNKEQLVEETGSIELPGQNLNVSQGAVPPWLEAILSRESIVVFWQRIVQQNPDESEFLQKEMKQYSGDSPWTGYYVKYRTRPGNHTMIIYGAYQNQDNAFWTSHADTGSVSFSLMGIKELEGRPVLYGDMSVGQDVKQFSTSWTNDGKVKMQTAPALVP